jgi:hypothetical protein
MSNLSPDLEYQIEQKRLETYRTVIEGAGKRSPPAETRKVDREKVAQALRDAWAPKKAEGST